MYDAVEVSWIRGRDPEILVLNCEGQPPSKREDIVALKTIKLASYTHEQLHWLLQCEGFSYRDAGAAQAAAAAGQKVPVPALPPAQACEVLEAVDSARWWNYVSIATATLITMGIILRCALKGPKGLLPTTGSATNATNAVKNLLPGQRLKLKQEDDGLDESSAAEML